MKKIISFSLVLVVCSCSSETEIISSITNFDILEASLKNLQDQGFVERNTSFYNQSIQKKKLFPTLQETPRSIAGLKVVSIAEIFDNGDNKAILLSSIEYNFGIYKVVFSHFDVRHGKLEVELNSSLEVLKVNRINH